MKVFITVFFVIVTAQIIHSQENRHTPVQQLLYDGNYAEAVIAISDSLKIDSVNHLLYYQLGKAQIGLDNYTDALNSFMQSHMTDTLFIPSMKELGLLYDYMGQPKKAVAFFQKILKVKPENREISSDLARIYKSNGYHLEAIQLYLYLIQDYPDNYVYHKNLGECYLKKNYPVEAWKYFSIANSLNPGDLRVIQRLGNLAIKSGNYIDGIALTSGGLSIDSSNVPLLKLNGYLHMLSENPDTAIVRFKQCQLLGDTSFFTLKYIGLSYFQEEEFDSSAFFLEHALQLDSMDVEANYYYATALGKALYKKESIKAFQNLLNILEPPQEMLVDIYSGLQKNFSYLSDHKKSLYYMLKLTEIDDNPIWYLRVASYYDYRNRDNKKAITYYQKFLDVIGDAAKNPYVEVANNRISKIREDMFFQGNTN